MLYHFENCIKLSRSDFLENKMADRPAKDEKRQFPRIRLRTPLRYQIRGTPESNNALSENVSVSGMGFINDSFIAPSSNVTLEINILSRIISPIGRIAWSSPLPHSDKYRLGIEFLEFNPVEKRYLGDFIHIQMEMEKF